MPLLKGEASGTSEYETVFINPEMEKTNGKSHGARVRRYRESDRPAIRRLCCDTGFLGNPIDPVFHDREIFADLFTGPYLEREADWAFVAEVDGKVVGYLLGSVCKWFDLMQMRNGLPIASKTVGKLLTGRYASHPRSKRFVRWLLTTGYWEQPKHPAGAAHLHFNLQNEYRGRGIARRLWEAYEERLHAAGVKECYGSFFSHPRRRPEQAYARYGFSVFDRRRTTLFHPEMRDVEIVCMCRKL
ncbi:MAG TPA: GNAT family N-acetyltransferase [Verrucomicrobiae bacterium]|nr:GNAT family N-acetyltransferase [Verrucomicrobiae bacterium]